MSRFPNKTGAFIAFLGTTDDYMQIVPIVGPSNPVRLGWTVENTADYHANRLAGDILYGKWTDSTQKTKTVNRNMKNFLKSTKALGQPLLNVIAASPNLITADEDIFDLVGDNNHAAKTKKEDAIQENIYTIFVAQGGGIINAKGRTATDAKRSSVPKGTGTNSVQRATSISTTATNGPTSPNDPLNTMNITSGASCTLDLGVENIGKFLNSWERWYDSKNPARAGKWSRKQVIPIM